MSRLTIRAQIVGKRGMAPAPREIPRPSGSKTVRDLIESIVSDQVTAFADRRREAGILRVLTERNVTEGCEAGRIVSGLQEPDDRLPERQQAIDAALSAFEDGFYYMFVNDTQVDGLDQEIPFQGTIDVLFVRLTPLAGG